MLSPDENSSLVDRLKNNDNEAFRALYHQYHHAVFANICRLVPQQQAAEDLLQEVFLALWEQRHKLTHQHSVAGWLFTTSYYKSSAWLKKSLKEKIALLPEDLFDMADDPTEGEMLFTERLSIIHAAVERL